MKVAGRASSRGARNLRLRVVARGTVAALVGITIEPSVGPVASFVGLLMPVFVLFGVFVVFLVDFFVVRFVPGDADRDDESG